MTAAPAPRSARLRRAAMMAVTIIGAIVAVPFMLILLAGKMDSRR